MWVIQKKLLKNAETKGEITVRSDNDVGLVKKAFDEKSEIDLAEAGAASSMVKPRSGSDRSLKFRNDGKFMR